MYRLNIAAQQLEECIQRGLFALTYKPQIEPGEILLLQLNKRDWKLLGERSGRIQYALVFQNLEYDADGSISKQHWPNAHKTWEWILHASQVLEVEPLSLEDLPLHRESHYQAQANPVRIDEEDEKIIAPYIKWPTAKSPSLKQNEDQEIQHAIYATDNNKALIENSAVDFVKNDILLQRFPDAQITIMPRNNPGYDIIVTKESKVLRYVEVKGTRMSKPYFHLTETERLFSKNNSSLYSLFVVWEIDLDNQKRSKWSEHEGEILIEANIHPLHYHGELPFQRRNT